MKLPQFFLLLLLSSSSVLNAQSTPEASAAMEVRSTTQGFLPPRMTTAQRDAISSPAEGLLIYNTTTQKINFYISSTNSWSEVEGEALAPTAVASFTFASTANFLENSPVHGNYQVVIGNDSTSTLNLTFATSDITFFGVSGVSVTAVSDAAETIAPGASHTVNYTLSGTPGNAGILTGAYAFGSLSANANITVDGNPLISHNGKDYYAVLSSTGKTWLDRDLGADQVATSSTDAASYGDLYQWGRNADGHEARTSSTAAGPVAIGSEGSNFITVSVFPNDWLTPQDNNRWNGTTKGTHDPCPSGFRVPTETELNNERLQFPSNNAAGAFASVLKLPAAGIRFNDGSLHQVGSGGYYWLSTTANFYSSRFLYFAITSSTNGAYMSNYTRGHGMSVRCIEQ